MNRSAGFAMSSFCMPGERPASAAPLRAFRAGPLVLASLLALPALAQSPPELPGGWTSQTLNNALLIQPPGNGPSRVALAVLAPGRPQRDVKTWFDGQTLSLAQASGRILGSTQVQQQDGIFVRVVQIENKQHVKLRDVFYGYPGASGLTVALLS